MADDSSGGFGKILFNLLSRVWEVTSSFAMKYPLAAGVLLVLWILGVPGSIFLCMIRGLGFGKTVRKGSYASKYQSRHLGGNIPKQGTFASLQSYAAKR